MDERGVIGGIEPVKFIRCHECRCDDESNPKCRQNLLNRQKPSGYYKRIMRTTAILFSVLFLATVDAYCPVVICPGFGNDQIDYDEPLKQPKEVGLRSVLARRGFPEDQIYTVPVQRSDWIRVAGGLLDIPDFYLGNAKATGKGYGWYLQRLKETVDLAHEQSGGEKVLLLAHSAGGWLARAAMADGTWCEENGIRTCDRVRCLATLGAIHQAPAEFSTCVTRGALQSTNDMFPGAFLKDSGIGYVSVGGAAIVGDNTKEQESKTDADELYANRGEGSASRVAFTSYEAVCGKGDVIGDGVVPFDWSQLEGSQKIRLDGVLHSINEAGTTIPTDRWYGSEGIVDSWLPTVLEEAGLSSTTKAGGFAPFAGLQEWASNLMVESNAR